MRRTDLLIVFLVSFLAVGPVAVGDELRTDSGQPRRAVLPDGSLIDLNQQTIVKVTADRHLKLSKGEVFVEVASRKDEKSFAVETAKREESAVRSAWRPSRQRGGVRRGLPHEPVSGLVEGDKETVRAGNSLQPVFRDGTLNRWSRG